MDYDRIKKEDLEINLENVFPDSVDSVIPYIKDIPLVEYEDLEKRIMFFGDSFVEISNDDNYHDDNNWTRELSKIFNRQHWNFGRSGSSLLFSINQFFKYIENDYREDDYIVFVTTSHTRFPRVHPNADPGVGAAMMRHVVDQWYLKSAEQQQPYFQWQPDLIAWLSQVYCNQEDFRHQCLMIDSYLKQLPNKTLLIPAFGVKDWVCPNKNFTLWKVAHLTGYTSPINHMTEKHNMILATQCSLSLQENKNHFNLRAYK